MIRIERIAVALGIALVLALPGSAFAQDEPPDNRWTKEATKHLTVADMRQDPVEKANLYQQALDALTPALTEAADNAKVWMLAGQIYIGLDRFEAADSALDRAEQLFPPYAEGIASMREQAWLRAFNAASEAMDRQALDTAIALIERAEVIYDQRPEGMLNLGILYSNAGNNEKAVEAFQTAIDRFHGPLLEKLPPEDQERWKEYEQIARSSMAQAWGNEGITAFQESDYMKAAAAFARAAEVNPYSRDYIYNHAQSVFARVADLERIAEGAKGDALEKVRAELAELYPRMVETAAGALVFDPYNPDLFILQARAKRGLSLQAPNEAAKAALEKEAMEIVEKVTAIPFDVTDISVNIDNAGVRLTGVFKNRSLKPGDTAKLRFSILAFDGQIAGSQEVTATLAEKEKPVPFEVIIPATGNIAGWKYEPVQ